MIELRWLIREVKDDNYRVSREFKTVLQYREWPNGVYPGSDVAPIWADVPVVDESSAASQPQEEK